MSFLTLVTVILFPLFSDEIQIRMWLSRLPYDYPNRVTGVARCLTAFSQPIPYVFYPAASINWITHGLIESPTFLRIVSVVFLLAWTLILIAYIKFKTQSKNLLLIISTIFGLLFIGINPIFISINRSEQFYYPAIILLLIISAYTNLYREPKFASIKLVVAFLLISLIFYGHPKGLFFLPFFFCVYWYLTIDLRYRKIIFILASLTLLYMSSETLKSWSGAFLCKEIPEYENFLKSFSFDPLSIFYSPTDFFRKAYLSISRFNEYSAHFEFKKEYIWGFLPGIKSFIYPITIFNKIVQIFLIFTFITTLISLLVFIVKKRTNRNINCLLLTLLVCTSIWAVFNLTKNIYDASFFYTITCLTLIFFIVENNLFVVSNKLFKIIIFTILSVSFVSQCIFISNNLIPFINGFTGPGIRIGSYEYNRTHNSIKSTAEACGIDRRNGRYIVIDDLTYGYFRKSHGPISFSYNGVGTTKTPLQDLFRTVDSDGMILFCSGFPAKFRQGAVRVDNICCMPKSEIKRLFIDTDNSELD
jgi:hypothetical protein